MAAVQKVKRYSWLANLAGRYKILVAILPLLGMFLVTGLITFQAQRAQMDMRGWQRHTYEVLLAINQIQLGHQANVIAADDYVLSPNAAKLTTLRDNRHATLGSLVRLRELARDNALQQVRLDHLQSLIARETSALNGSMLGGQSGTVTPLERDLLLGADYLAARKAGAIEIVALLQQMSATEQSLLTARSQRLDRSLWILRVIIALGALAGVLYSLYAIQITHRVITNPVRQITDMMSRVAAHDTSVVVTRLGRKDEIGELARALQAFKQMSLDSQSQNLIKTSVSAISHVLLQATTHKDFAQWLTSEVVPLCNAGLGLFYSFDDARHRLDLLGSYGLRLSNRSADQYMPGEGLVGQCAVERKAIILNEVPAGYLRIDSGSGEAVPSHVAILPVIYRDTLIGVLELGSFAPLTTSQRALLDELLPIVALALENLNQAVHTQDLLLQTQEQAGDLRLSELVMRQQKEVLGERNETLQTKTTELEEQSQRLLASQEDQRVQAEELRASNDELREMAENLSQQKVVLEALQLETEEKAAELARASQYKSEFLANMSHELRTPLNSLLILSRSLADNDTGNLDEEQIESAQIIHDAGNSLLHLINDILDLSKVEAGKMELMVEDLSLADLGRRMQRTFAHVAQAKQLRFEISIEPGLPAAVATDGSKVEQIANNLLSNAFKFTAQGAVRLHIGRPSPSMEIPDDLADQPLLAISVSDTGIGIAPDKLERVFNAFEQVDASTSRQFGGTGLGLAISRRMAQLLGGDVILQSETGRGSQFTLLLPETPPETAWQPVDVEEATTDMSRRFSSSSLLPATVEDDRQSLQPGQTVILVIEDDAAFLRILIDMIHRKGYRALAASDGESGLQLAGTYHPSGILLDVSLPVMDGWTVLDRLKMDEATRDIPVHFMSVSDGRTRGLASGAIGFLTKPVSRESIGEALDRLLSLGEGKQRRLLVVEDDRSSRKAIRVALRAHHVDVDEAESAEAALLQIAENHYDCIVLDLGLPGMSGLELLEQLSEAHEVMPPVVVYSGRELDASEQLTLRKYTDAIVLKGARSSERLLQEVGAFLQAIPRPVVTAEKDRPKPVTLAGHRVLLVDDDMRNLFALSKVLRGWGLQVSMAQDGYKALAALENEERPDLVLMDIMMPGMDGYATIRAIREQSDLDSLPIIAVTAKAMAGDREVCLEMGANDYLSKPIDIDKLSALLQTWLKAGAA